MPNDRAMYDGEGLPYLPNLPGRKTADDIAGVTRIQGRENPSRNHSRRAIIRADSEGSARRYTMDLRCPNCNSSDLKSLSLAFQEGRFNVTTRSRLRGVVVGDGGPDVVVGTATTRGVQQSDLSKKLSPPTKWSYGKVVLWSVVVSFAALVIYVRSVMSHPGPASSLPVTLYAVIFPIGLVVLLAAIWRHNHSTYAREYAEWSRSFVCERCGTVSQQDVVRASAA